MVTQGGLAGGTLVSTSQEYRLSRLSATSSLRWTQVHPGDQEAADDGTWHLGATAPPWRGGRPGSDAQAHTG